MGQGLLRPRAALDAASRRVHWLARTVRVGLAGLMAIACGLSAGCTSMLLDKQPDISQIFGPIGRKAKQAVEITQRDPLAPLEGSEELEAAQKLYDRKEYAQARKAFKKVAKKYKDKPIEEEAMFMLAESSFAQQRFPAAQDDYDELLNKYPSSRYIEKSTRRLYTIAQYWLDSPKPPSQVELAHFTRHEGPANLDDIPDARVPFQFPLTPNLLDRTRPLFDTRGRALQALNSVTNKDPTGPLSDDALMMIATHHLRKRDYQEADHYFSMIREQYGDSEHAPAAYVLGQHASYESYQGTKYDSKQLEEARKLTDSALRLYPDIAQKGKLEGDMRKIKLENAERYWTRIEFHMKRGEKEAAAVTAEYLVNDHPQSPRAADARQLLLNLGPEYSMGILRTPVHKPPSMPVEKYEQPDDAEPEEPGRVEMSDEARPALEE